MNFQCVKTVPRLAFRFWGKNLVFQLSDKAQRWLSAQIYVRRAPAQCLKNRGEGDILC